MALMSHHRFGSPGAMSTVAAIAVDDTGAVAHTITAQKSGISIQNVGTGECWFGDENVDPSASRGNILLPKMIIIFENVQKTFKIYFKCAAGVTTSIGIVEITP